MYDGDSLSDGHTSHPEERDENQFRGGDALAGRPGSNNDDDPSTEDKAKALECAKRAKTWKESRAEVPQSTPPPPAQPAQAALSPSQVQVPPSPAFPTAPNTPPVLPIDPVTGNFQAAPKGPTPYTNSRANLGNPVQNLDNPFAKLSCDDEDE